MSKTKNNVDSGNFSPFDENSMNSEDGDEASLVQPSDSENFSLEEPEFAGRNEKWNTAKTTIYKQKKNIRCLQQSLRRVKTKVNNINMLFKFLMDNNLVNDAGRSVIQAVLKE